MQLGNLHLKNFRRFRDETVEFARGSERNVTVIHGANGSGKTTLLNAFTWLFYEDVGFDAHPERLASEGAMGAASVGDQVTVSVQLEFDHNGTEYIATRTATYEKRSGTDFDGKLEEMTLTVKFRNGGEWKTREDHDPTLDQIIPERLSELFFFDGEDIGKLAETDNQGEIQEAIQNIMGLTILERATKHLGKVAKRFEKEIDEYASDELSQLLSDKRDIEEQIEELEREKTDTKRAKTRLEDEITDLEQTLENLDESAQLQEDRNEYQDDRDRLNSQIEGINDDIKDEISDSGFAPLAIPLINETADDLDEMRKEGVIPSELSNSYIDSLLEAGECICGRSLVPGTEHYEQISSMKGDSAADGVEQSALRIIGHLNSITERESSFFENVDNRIEKRKELHDEVEILDDQIDQISSKLHTLDQRSESGQTISELESEREQKKDERDELVGELARIEERMEVNEQELEEIQAEIDNKRDEREEALVGKRRQKAAETVQTELDHTFEELKDKVRQWSNRQVQETFSQIANKDLTAEITTDFELRIWEQVDDDRGTVDISMGERQIASLAFIGSLVKLARKQHERDTSSEYFRGGIYPLVMDSPFGALDNEHRKQVSRIIPTLANQVVVFATDAQWEGPVEKEMQSLAGEQYWLDFDSGEGTGEYPRTRITAEHATARGD